MHDKPYLMVLRGIIQDDQGRVLLMQRSKRSLSFPGCWELPGGKVDPGEHHEAAFIREIREETSFLARPGRLFEEFEWERENAVVICRIFWAKDVSGSFQISDEHDAFGWYSAPEMAKLAISAPLKGSIEKLREVLCA